RKTRWLTKAIATLNERERSIIKRRRLTEDVATLDELGNEMGISKERVRQIEVKALEKLRTALLEINPEFAGLAS
ncbi:MAG: RNA polymerase factor sigma-32, partial [Nitratireductor sp.]|nr:RNA polymerase factor sigma-32 [Nitratireductor sp.]